jgi:methionyl-tRNA formyltransferase
VPLRFVFIGTSELACASLDALARANLGSVVGVVTQPDRPKGRDLKLQPPPVKRLAERLSLPVIQPAKVRHDSVMEALAAWQPDLIVVAAYGQILPQRLLDLPRYGCLNVHASLLPKYRGAAPIQAAILNDDSETGVTIMKIDAGLDTGDMLSSVATPIDPSDNAQTLHDRLALLGGQLLIETIPGYVTGAIKPTPQPAQGASYAGKITKEAGHLDWSQPARALWNRVRAFTPWPGAFTYEPAEPQPRLLKIWEAAVVTGISGLPGQILKADGAGLVVGCGENALRILALQREGKRRMNTAEFLAGHELPAGLRLQ